MASEEKSMLSIKKPDLSGIKAVAKKPLTKKIINSAYLGLLCYTVIFVLSEILISGGKSEHNPYYIAVIVIFLIAAQILFISKKVYSDLKSTIISAFCVTITIAILDYLIVNLWLGKNNLEIYKYWPYYFLFVSTLALPFIRSNCSKFKSLNLKSLLTKKKRTL